MKEWLPEEIADFQTRHGLKVQEMATMLGVTREYIFHLKKGSRIPSDTMRRLLDCLDKQNEHGQEVNAHGKAQGDIPAR